jgi:excisionase family DNA binding protein
MKTLPEELRTIRKSLKVSELADRLNVSPQALYDLVKSCRIPFFRVGYAIRFDPALIATWVEERSQGPMDKGKRKTRIS